MEFIDQVICAESESLLKEIADQSVNVVVTSPPYFGQRDYGKGIGYEDEVEQYADALVNVFLECFRVTKDDGSIFFNIGDKYIDGSLALAPYVFAREACKRSGAILINQITWVKPNPQPRQFKRRLVSSTEPIFHFVKGKDYKYFPDRFMEGLNLRRGNSTAGNNIGAKYFDLITGSDLTEAEKETARKELKDIIDEVKSGKIWSFRMKIRGIHSAAYGGYEGGRKEHLRAKGFTIIRMYDRPMKRDVIECPILNLKFVKHPAVYPETIVEECLNLTTEKGDMVLDPFLGSGTTAVVAKRMGRHYIGIDSNEKYCEDARRRIKDTKIEPDIYEFVM